MNDEEKKVLNIVRSLIISSNPRNGLCLRELLVDYHHYEGRPLPLFKHKSVVEFLQSSGEFDVTSFNGEHIVHAKISSKSRHISKLVAEQNTTRGSYRGRHSVQERLTQTNHLLYSKYPQSSHTLPKPQVLHRGVSTVFSFEELKAEQNGIGSQCQASDISCNRNDSIIIDEIGETSINEFKEFIVEYQQMNKLELPWADEYWSLFITCCMSTTEIWGRLAGKHCRVDPTASEFQEDIRNNTKRATVFNVGRIYVTITRDIAYRIRIDNIDYVNNRILCFFLDEGDTKWLPINEIYDCQSKSMKCPPQAVCYSLHGLENFVINKTIAHRCLESKLLGRSVTGRIFTTKENFISHNENNGTNNGAIQAAFLDASGDFIDLHRDIIKQMYDGMVVPELVTTELTLVEISHIADNGDIFCQLQPSAVDYVKKLIAKFVRRVSNNPFTASEKAMPISFHESLFVVHDSETNRLYRAKVINEVDAARNMYFIDYGHTKLIPSSKMYLIESHYMEDEIFKFPPQAIRTKLIGVSDLAVKSSVNRLRSHFSLKRKAYVRKMPSSTIVPEIKLYFDAESFMVCVNDSLEWERERSRIIVSTDSAASHIPDTIANSHSIVDRIFVEAAPETSKIEKFLPPELNSCFEVEIVKTESPSNFVIKLTEHIPQWQKQMKNLQSHCKENSSPVTPDMIKDGQPYACLKSNGLWHRAIIKFHRTQMYAFFCDIAEIDTINDLNKIKLLPREYLTIPKQAMSAKLFGIEPVNGTWEMDDNVQFHRMTKGNRFMAQVVNVLHDKWEENSVLEIILKHKQNVILNDLFVASGRAIQSKMLERHE